MSAAGPPEFVDGKNDDDRREVMKFTQVTRDEWISEYDVLYDALIDAHKAGNSLRVELEGKHHGGVLMAIRKRHSRSSEFAEWSVGSARDQESDAIVLTMRKGR